MVLDKLKESLLSSIKKVQNALFVDDTLIQELIKDIQRALLVSDIQVSLVFELTKKIKQRLQTEKTPATITKKEHIIQIVYDELTAIMGTGTATLALEHKPTIVLLVGLFGNGKTTTTAKLAKYYTKRAKKVAIISIDTTRPAAFTQLKQLGEQIHVPVFGDPTQKDPVKVYQSQQEHLQDFDIVFVDTAGRDALTPELVTEITQIQHAVKPHQTVLIMNADIGQSAQAVARGFKEQCAVTGVIISKMDGTAKGGGALTACAIVQAPVLFIGTGEKVDEFSEFKPRNFVGQLLGMGDIETLLVKAQDAFDQVNTQDLSKRLLKGEFTLIDLYEQMQAMQKMGPLGKVMELIPGFSSAQLPKEALAVQEEKMKLWKFVMDSCTKAELEDPSIISVTRIERIAKGSGTDEKEVRELLKHYKQSKKMIKVFKGMGTQDPEKELSEKDMKKMFGKMRNAKGLFKQLGQMR
jgi:signal recognition particle subunit SRP54